MTLAKIEEAMCRHRLEEAAMLADMTATVLRAITTLAGPSNGLGSAVEARTTDALTLAETIRRHSKEYLRPKVEVTHQINESHTEAVRAARGVA